MTDTNTTTTSTPKPVRYETEVDYSKILDTTISVECADHGTMVFFFLWASAEGFVYGGANQTDLPNLSLVCGDLEHYTRSFLGTEKGNQPGGFGYHVEARVVVTIPDVELTEEEALARLEADWGADPWKVVKDRYQQAVKATEAKTREENAAWQANAAVRHFRDKLLKDAMAASRYEQRLAALQAELEAEVKVQFEAQRAEIGEDLANNDALDLVDDFVHSVVMSALEKNLPSAPSGFFSPAPRRYVKPTDVSKGEG